MAKPQRRGIEVPSDDLPDLLKTEPAAVNLLGLEKATHQDEPEVKPKRTRNYENGIREGGGQVTLRLDPEIARRFKEMSEAGGWLQGSLASKLLEYAMNAVERGDLQLREDNRHVRRKTVL